MHFELKIMFKLLFIIILSQVFPTALCYGNEPIPSFQRHRASLVSVALFPDGSTLASDQDNDAVPQPYARMLTDIFCVGVYGHCFGIAKRYPTTGEVRAFSNLGGNYFVSVICCCGDAGGGGASISDADRVNSVAFSSDGNYVAIGVDLRWAWIWDLSSDRRTGWGERGASEVYDVAFSPDGRYLATGDDDGNAILWEVSTWWAGDVNSQYMVPGGNVLAVAFSPDGQYLAVDGYDGSNTSVIIWDVSSGTRVRRLSAGNVFAIAFRPDGRYIAAGDADGIITFWQTDSWVREKQIRTGGTVTDLAWSPGGNLISDGKKVYRPLLLR